MQTRHAALNIGDEPIKNIRFTWGGDYPKERRHLEGWGTAVEVPAVLALLDKVVAGELTAEKARAVLSSLAEKVLLACDPQEADPIKRAAARCFGNCDECVARKPEFDRRLHEVLVQRERYLNQTAHPWAATRSALHRITCREVKALGASRGGLFTESGETNPDEYDQHLHWFTHDECDSIPGEGRTVLARHEAASWIAERTGPRGGERFKLCGNCQPERPDRA
ncbi:hypothetical protein ACFRSX_31110 [Streptomyces goshikiensis]|uniref:hypothetical protein n=1 Tax=Streptomyces TaxID=1883 RepID=UPI000C27A293|nr:hypothetical protein [Streptomyces sp. CB02120-2]PJN14622.1 hypothetical protein CG724_33610 [Streptomyces sp. CB02120-2]